MKKGRRNFPAKFKAKVAIEAVEGGKTLSELSTKHEVHSAMISAWKKTLTERAEELFESQRGRPGRQLQGRRAKRPRAARLAASLMGTMVHLCWMMGSLKRLAGQNNRQNFTVSAVG